MPQLLHGMLIATIYEVDKLRTGINLCCSKDLTPKKFLAQIKRALLCRPEIVGSKLYASVDLDKARVGRTRMLNNQPSNPKWNESFRIYCAHNISHIIFTIKDDDLVGATLLGRAYLPVEEIMKGYEVDKWVQILDEERYPIHGGSKIHVKLKFYSATQDPNWCRGIASPQYQGVPWTFFKQRTGCRVTLYQDAHVADALNQLISSTPIKDYQSHRCWVDIFDAISNAKHLIYITGWSVYPEITLIRDPNYGLRKPESNQTLGELLKKKANEGVKVLLLVWDDRTSNQQFKKDGVMATHDQETETYFRNTNVHCVLCPRNPDEGRSIVQGFEISTMFTHHQKSVIVDCEGLQQEGERRIVSFVGGIDLCDGRYDTQDHPLFHTLGTIHHDDFHQPNFAGSSIRKGGPREPWHDIHCRLEGPVAWDVLYNFEQRWIKRGDDKLLIPLNKLDKIITYPSPVTSANDPETWNVQIFRSIDNGAASGFPENPKDAANAGLVGGKNVIIDRSIQDAYIHAIRRAKNFIYIENQYFIGSSYGWKSTGIIDADINALHLIPKELSLKIVSKIEAGERFTVYVVIPMWPEGIPDSASVQAILDWQRRTIGMMYSDIIQALQTKGLDENPMDYLTFFCLGTREERTPGEYLPPEAPEQDSDYSRAQQSRRFMIYVHSKMMIVDDEYIIIGSANINQRSMDGARDSEIAMGGYQPHHLAGDTPGQIHGFRMGLWMEHIQVYDESFRYPQTVECIRKVNQIAQTNWDFYSDTTVRNLRGYLLRYPIQVSRSGAVEELPGFKFFPDTKAKVLGTKSDYIPPILTT